VWAIASTWIALEARDTQLRKETVEEEIVECHDCGPAMGRLNNHVHAAANGIRKLGTGQSAPFQIPLQGSFIPELPLRGTQLSYLPCVSLEEILDRTSFPGDGFRFTGV
jgi:hypothetical protein